MMEGVNPTMIYCIICTPSTAIIEINTHTQIKCNSYVNYRRIVKSLNLLKKKTQGTLQLVPFNFYLKGPSSFTL
jgi:hypothetical protein